MKDLNYQIHSRYIRPVFTPVNIFSWTTASIELKATFLNIKANDYFYIRPTWYSSFNILWSDKSAGLNHNETSNDWFHEYSLAWTSFNNLDTSWTLIKE